MLSGGTEDDANVVIVPSTTLAANRVEAAAIVTGNVFEWKGVEVPQAVHISLSTPYRGLTFGKKDTRILDQFHEIPILVPAVPGATLTTANNVKARLVCKFDIKFAHVYSPGDINTGKLLPTLLSHPDVPDDVKQTLTNGAHASCAIEWRDAWHNKRKSVESSGFVALACAEAYPDMHTLLEVI
ncbi:hypothetical protein CYMTET_28814 [Cymbomonas tetramitiformis]|uniref:Uncharacterized protein n=1 Tax=Cymbomonas tetramitiformis TaxID=36881 RepID=A0AAE0FM64_9CHLO|nr:hypothetical protein CYMTET_42709 [Cymbomonas tetramitiformis]KAK3262319.1 hypothetical protein CYMTET_28814 [Cymbomonas tetramitiformis]